jgi:hypothetical protein
MSSRTAILYTGAKLPDGLGAELTPIPFTVTVSWTYPTPGRQQFSVIGTAKNVNPAGVAEPLVGCRDAVHGEEDRIVSGSQRSRACWAAQLISTPQSPS